MDHKSFRIRSDLPHHHELQRAILPQGASHDELDDYYYKQQEEMRQKRG